MAICNTFQDPAKKKKKKKPFQLHVINKRENRQKIKFDPLDDDIAKTDTTSTNHSKAYKGSCNNFYSKRKGKQKRKRGLTQYLF